MNVRGLLRLSGAALTISLALPDSGAHAFCRATTLESAVDSCIHCATEGYPIAWPEPHVEYIFNENGIPGFTDSEVRGIYADAFARWLAVRCDGEQVEIEVEANPGTTSLGVREMEVESTTNVMGYMSSDEWSEHDYDPHAFAQTGVRYYPTSGRLAGADIWLNGGIGEFGVCPAGGCPDLFSTVDLPNVITHEIGHFFGLAHSDVKGATMGCDALPGDTNKRTLERDDREGMCAIYPPGVAFQAGYEQGEWLKPKGGSSSCSVSPASNANENANVFTPLLGFGVGLWFWTRRHLGRARTRTL